MHTVKRQPRNLVPAEPGPGMEWCASVNHEETDRDEEGQHHEASDHAVGRQITPLGIHVHAPREDNQAQTSCSEAQDRAYNVSRCFRRHSINHRPREDSSYDESDSARDEECGTHSPASRALYTHVQTKGKCDRESSDDAEV